MNKQQQTVLNMAGFIKSQSLTLLEKLDALDADEQAAMCEKLHEIAEELQNSIQTRFEAESAPGYNSVSCSRQDAERYTGA
ncbi:Rop family plasmid primer RNA-binding protein [Shigella sonnei]|nr:Rop family plasmid primer RNA-binding protein [Shigella sonnei]OXW98236.1 Rop family plasmid primer RNA-binding protein [Shigella sonnei]PHU64182.1 Rop family plasmid primer RNA-binding protein [Shigella sonnei]PHU64250.1 Rop family plasmid primer RNA-binding protein [Shigella sonnei]PHU72993.1 Rop family plasmid primer RNA-binding protein [Shigella sonnei]